MSTTRKRAWVRPLVRSEALTLPWLALVSVKERTKQRLEELFGEQTRSSFREPVVVSLYFFFSATTNQSLSFSI